MKKAFTLSTAIAATVAVSASNALVVDQQQTEINYHRSFTYYDTAQSFTPTINALKAIQLNMVDGGGFPVGGDVYLTLHLEDPANEVIAQTQAVFLEDCFNFEEGPGCNKGGGTSVPVTFEFPESVPLQLGETYVFGIHANDNLPFSVAYTNYESYSNGELFLDNITQQEDLAFKTLAPEITVDPNQDSVLVMGNNTIYRYSYAGVLLETIEIPNFYQWDSARDIIPVSETEIAVFNGQFNPNLSIYDGDSWAHREYDEWSIVANVSYGGIAADANYIYLTDMKTGSGGTAQGIVRFDRQLETFARFLTDDEYIDITLGEDGLLYALEDTYGHLQIVNPATMGVEREVDLGHISSSRAATADENGNIFLAGWNGAISKFDPEGNLVASVSTTAAFSDIDIRGDNILVTSYYEEEALLYTTELEYVSTFSAGGRYTFAAFSYLEPEVEKPEPEVTAELAITSDWNAGYCANVILTNTTDEPQVWDVALEVEGSINNLWNGNWSQSGSTLSVSGLSWNDVLQPDQINTSVGFCASR
ncbi:cellulose binding domain-containing protein [Gilvimarinus sp. SDUM040013]|uniref:Cellulose binding domain-containing protein n=1 Tax=Gilvimarinus gilvus TaxID=3058038 RepID=A0ABU4S335_9GAMM|nr:cellulose binding domain-containing protein [Gilvimarinus sp. SDUM040013]MDO3387625.1 cellulose binding domain-containing protein [Gilvimarinus sp. SDUM040013]MDX6851566.1 cellulose binding domain-containing protein [Gilvimarinus sp. SDUM040013]